MQRHTLPLVAALTAVGGGAAPGTDENARTEVMRAVEEFRRAFAAGNIEGIERYYSDDLLKFRSGAPPEERRFVTIPATWT